MQLVFFTTKNIQVLGAHRLQVVKVYRPFWIMEKFPFPKKPGCETHGFSGVPRLRYAHILPMWKMRLLGFLWKVESAKWIFLNKKSIYWPQISDIYYLPNMMPWNMYLLSIMASFWISVLDFGGGTLQNYFPRKPTNILMKIVGWFRWKFPFEMVCLQVRFIHLLSNGFQVMGSISW